MDFKKMKKEELLQFILDNNIGNTKALNKLLKYNVNLSIPFFSKMITNEMLYKALEAFDNIEEVEKEGLIDLIYNEETKRNGMVEKKGLKNSLQTKTKEQLNNIYEKMFIEDYIKSNN